MSLDTQTKLAIEPRETGQRPSQQVVAERVRADVSSVREIYVGLARSASVGVGIRWSVHSHGSAIFRRADPTCRNRR